jgi:hypothetical protein
MSSKLRFASAIIVESILFAEAELRGSAFPGWSLGTRAEGVQVMFGSRAGRLVVRDEARS